uniref:Uncharacterized protein n=1 Tax=Romanomermis culicivorax TaxID=13658 RepID=A0A915KSB3_ROMCU
MNLGAQNGVHANYEQLSDLSGLIKKNIKMRELYVLGRLDFCETFLTKNCPMLTVANSSGTVLRSPKSAGGITTSQATTV